MFGLSRFGLSAFSLSRFGLSRFGHSRFGHGFSFVAAVVEPYMVDCTDGSHTSVFGTPGD
jgi:hypothetical protein